MHTDKIPDSAGDFSPPEQTAINCRRCDRKTVERQLWESHCGAYEDHRYTCTSCGHVWWVDGIDA
jgi:DNA-directed RNA polymerase subunit M/transcription elongation factor TFIIS